MACRFCTCLRLILFTFSALLFTSTANAHFNLNLNVRIIHVEHLSDGMSIYMRLPMPYYVYIVNARRLVRAGTFL